MRLTLEKQKQYACELVSSLRGQLGDALANGLLEAEQHDQAGIDAQRARVAELKQKLQPLHEAKAKDLLSLADVLVEKSVWIVGGDGWAYDIGYGGLDHVIASGANVNILVMDTEVYSNTGGQASKATPLAAVAKFASAGKPRAKKNLGRLAIEYGNVYVAQIAMGASDSQTVKAFLEAESYPGVSIIIAYSHCIAHGIDMSKGLEQQRLASLSGHWSLYRYDPRLKLEGKNPLQLDSKAPSIALKDYAYNETRYKMLAQSNPEAAEGLMKEAQNQVNMHWLELERMARNFE
jgi:pyruvate-ferredoxin/flavodoxin oxidoreductase